MGLADVANAAGYSEVMQKTVLASVLAFGLGNAAFGQSVADDQGRADCLSTSSPFFYGQKIVACESAIAAEEGTAAKDKLRIAKARYEILTGQSKAAQSTVKMVQAKTLEAELLRADLAVVYRDFDLALAHVDLAKHLASPDLVQKIEKYEYRLRFWQFEDRAKTQNAEAVYQSAADFLATGASARMKHQILTKAGAYALNVQHDKAMAERLFARAMQDFDGFPEAFAVRGALRKETGDLAGALDDYHQAFLLRGKSSGFKMPVQSYAELLELEGLARLRLSDYFGSADAFRKVINVTGQTDLVSVRAYFTGRVDNLLKLKNIDFAMTEANVARSFYSTLHQAQARAEIELKFASLFLSHGFPQQADQFLAFAEPTADLLLGQGPDSSGLAMMYVKLASLHLGRKRENAALSSVERAKGVASGQIYEAAIAEALGDMWSSHAQIQSSSYLLAAENYGRAGLLTPRFENKRQDWLRLRTKQVQAHLSAGQRDVAYGLINEAEKLFILSDRLFYLRAEILAPENSELAVRNYTQALNSARSDEIVVRSLIGLGRLSMAAGQPEEARTFFQKATNTRPDTIAAWQGLAQIASESGDVHEQNRILGELIRLNPDDQTLRLDRGVLLQNSGSHDSALVDFSFVLQGGQVEGPQRDLALFHRSISLFSLDRIDDALADLNRISPNSHDAALVALWKGRIAIRQRNAEQASRFLKSAFAELPQDVLRTYQGLLAKRGIPIGSIDGVYGPATDRAIRRCAQVSCF